MVQYSTPNASLYAALAAKLAGVPVRLYCQWGMAYVGFHGIKRVIFKRIEKLVCTLSTWVEPDSFGNLKFSHAEGLYPENKGSVIWNGSASGVNLNKFDNSQKPVWRAEIRENMRSRTMRLFLALSAVLRATRASTSCWRRSKHSCKKQRRIPFDRWQSGAFCRR